MKILVISLLRLGDILIASPSLSGLRKKYPDAKIDLLVNQNFISVKSFLPDVDTVIGFDRNGLQDGLAESSCPLLEPLDYLGEITAQLKSNHYDLVVNLTQNKLSGYLTTLVGAKEQMGLSLNSTGQPTYSSTWFRYLNDYVAAGGENAFHYSDIFYSGLSLPAGESRYNFKENEKGKAEVLRFFLEVGYASGPKIVVQALTSDLKKNLGATKWIEALTQFQSFETAAHIFLLGAPNEKSELDKIQIELKNNNVRCDVAIMSLDGALSLLNVSDLLITGDTSIKHLACSTPIKIFEIAIGSSDHRKTGAYKTGSLILKSNEACSPCPHSMVCSRDLHYCSQNIPSELIAMSASKYLHNDWLALRVLATEYSDCAELIRTEWAKYGFWLGQSLSEDKAQSSLIDQLNRAAWKFLLEKEHLKPLAAYGSASLKIKEGIEFGGAPVQELQIKLLLEQIEGSTVIAESRLNKILATLSQRMRLSESSEGLNFVDDTLKQEIFSVEGDLGFGKIFTEKLDATKLAGSGFYHLRQLQNSLNEAFSHQQIKLKLIKSLRNQLTEAI